MKRGNLVTGWLAAVCLCGCGKEPSAQTPGDPDAPVTILNIIHAILDSFKSVCEPWPFHGTRRWRSRWLWRDVSLGLKPQAVM